MLTINSNFVVKPKTVKTEVVQPAILDEDEIKHVKGLSEGMFGVYISIGVVLFVLPLVFFLGQRGGYALIGFIIGIIACLTFVGLMNQRAKGQDRARLLREKQVRLNERTKDLNTANHRSAEREASTLTTALGKSFDAAPQSLAALYSALSRSMDHLNDAEQEFQDNAFGPFWDAVERATLELDQYQQQANLLANQAREYEKQLAAREHNFPPYPVRNGHIPDSSSVIAELRRVVRLGQTDFQFANIWEHRRTREVMITGFRNLEEAVNNVGAIVESSISNLQDSISADIASLSSEMAANREQEASSQAAISDAISKQSESQASQSSALTAELGTMKKQLDSRLNEQSIMLDNIRRGRKPGILAKDHGRDK